MNHPVHLHGQRFLVLSRDGVPNENLAWKDTALLPVGATVVKVALRRCFTPLAGNTLWWKAGKLPRRTASSADAASADCWMRDMICSASVTARSLW